MRKRILSILLALILTIGTIPNLFVNVSAAVSTPSSASVLSERMSNITSGTYGIGKYFRNDQSKSCYFSGTSSKCHGNHGGSYATNDNYCNCKVATSDIAGTTGGIQCFGYARYVFYQLFGLSISTSMTSSYYALSSTTNIKTVGQCSEKATSSSVSSIFSSAKMGDFIQARTSSGGSHSMIVYSVSSSQVTVLECNHSGNCYIGTRNITWSSFASEYPKFTVYRANNYPSGSTTHTHSYAGYNWEAAHPHKCYKTCSTCGATKYIENEYYKVSTCSQCSFTQDSKYGGVKGFKAYPCVSSTFEVKTSDLSTRAGEIYTTDYCTINEVYTNGWCKVTFPMDSGGTRTAYTKISNFIKSPSTTMGTFTAQTYMNLYSTSSMGTKIFRIYPKDKCITIGTSGSATQVFMPHSDGYYVLGWVKTSEIPGNSSYSVDSRYPTPFKCRVLSSSKVPAALSVGGARQSDMNVYVDDDCVIQEVYTNGWCKFTCPWSDGSTKTLYLPLSEFINANVEPYTFKATQYADTYYKSDKATKVGWIDNGDSVTVVSTSGSMTQVIYPADVGKRCGWANSSALTTTYTVTYNANGGSGAPAKQSKTPGTALTLSSTKPTRTGYTFVGWATSSSATTAQYSAGSVYTNDSSVTLYAVWRKQSFTITYNANGGANAPGAQTQTYGSAITVTNSKPEKAYDVTFNANGGEVNTNYYSLDCAFASWNTKSNGSGTTVKSGASYTPNANVTLYAIYTNPKLGNYPIPSKEGYTFDGWYTAKTGGTRVDATTVISGDTTLYAQWSLETYSVVYFDDGSDNIPDEQTKTYGAKLILSSQIPSKSGYRFLGWATSESINTVAYKPGATYSENDWIILYPVWEKINTTPVTIVIESKEVQQGDTISVKVSIDDNPGIWGMDLKISYDKSALTLVSVNNGDFYQDSEWTPGNLNGDVYILSYEASGFENVTTKSAVLATLNFKVNNAATVGDYAITATYDSGDIINVNFDDITASITNGKITVKNKNDDHFTGIKDDYFYKDGVLQRAYQLVEFEGNYYFINNGNMIAKNTRIYLSQKFVEGTDLVVGYYDFDAEGKLVMKNGPEGDFFYRDGIQLKAYQLVEFEGDYYFINDGNRIAKNIRIYLSQRFVEGTPLAVGYYEFGADGKMAPMNGPIGDYFYKDGVMQKAYQLVEYKGNFYFVNDSHKLAKNKRIYLSERFTNGFTYSDGTPITPGYYDFDENGKMVFNGPIGDYFYKDGAILKAYQLVEYKGDYYFVNDSNKLAKNKRIYLSQRFVEGTTLAVGYYEFGADGKMVALNGPVGDYFYKDGAMLKAYQLVEFEGNYYFINDSHKLAKNTRIYLSQKFVEGTDLAVGYYDFDANGKLIIK